MTEPQVRYLSGRRGLGSCQCLALGSTRGGGAGGWQKTSGRGDKPRRVMSARSHLALHKCVRDRERGGEKRHRGGGVPCSRAPCLSAGGGKGCPRQALDVVCLRVRACTCVCLRASREARRGSCPLVLARGGRAKARWPAHILIARMKLRNWCRRNGKVASVDFK